ncbi:MAG TPA: hypothetical protein VIW47_06885, partial [Nitrospiraceae bacterium]
RHPAIAASPPDVRQRLRGAMIGFEGAMIGCAARCEAGLCPAVGALLEVGAMPLVRPMAQNLRR